MTKHASALLFSTTLLVLTACGGETNSSTENSDNTSHPEFSWAKVAVSNNYSPSGYTTDLTPTFTWKAIPGATKYNFGHELTFGNGKKWKEYTVSAVSAGCTTGATCNYNPTDHTFTQGEEVAWWVRGKVASQWGNWSNPYVFNVVGDIKSDIESVHTQSPSDGEELNVSTPYFKFYEETNARKYIIGIEKTDGTEWQSFTFNAAETRKDVFNEEAIDSPKALSDGAYSWWIRAQLKNGQWTNWSMPTRFSINVAGKLKAFQPKGIVNTRRQKFSWLTEANATEYQLRYQTNNAWQQFTIPTFKSSFCNMTNCALVTLPESGARDFQQGKTYTWYVRAKVNDNWQEWTSGTTFTVRVPLLSTKPGNIRVGSKPSPRGRCRYSCEYNLRSPTSLSLRLYNAPDKSIVKKYYLYRDDIKIATLTQYLYEYHNWGFAGVLDEGLTPNTAYTYVVKSVDAAGNILATSDESIISTRKAGDYYGSQ